MHLFCHSGKVFFIHLHIIMYKTIFNKRSSIKFKQFSNKGYALFAVLGREVLVGTLSVATLTYAHAEGMSTHVAKATTDTTRISRELEIDEVCVTGTRAPLTRSQQARMVTVLNREDIQAAPVQSVNDLLKYVAGVDVRQRGPVGAQTDVGVRGGNYEQVTILLNGVNINDPQTGHNAFDFPVDVSDIERIEVLEGPAARVYGTSSLLGAINIVTRMPRHSSVAAKVETGSFGYLKGGASASWAKGQWNNALSGSFTRSDSYNRSRAGKLNMNFNGGKAFYQGKYEDELVRVDWHTGLSTKGFGCNSFYSGYSDEQYERTLKTYTALQAVNKQGVFKFHPIVYWNRNFDRFELFHNNPDAYPFNYHRTDIFGANLNSYFDWVLGRTAFGMELRQEEYVSGNMGEKLARPHHIHGTDRDYLYGINRTNVQLVFEHNILLPRFTLSMGMVALKNSWSEMRMKVYPSVDASYSIGRHWKVYASYNSSMRLPSVTELFYNSKGYNANRNLQPEELSATEMGTTYQAVGVTAKASVYYNHMKNLIDWIVDRRASKPMLTTMNFGQINSLGAEMALGLDIYKLWPGQRLLRHFDVNYAYLHQHQKQFDGIVSRYVLEYLKHKLTARLQLNLWRQLCLGAYYRYQWREGSYVSGYDFTTHTNLLSKYAPYSVLDSRLSWEGKSWHCYVQANNLTGHRFSDFGRLIQPGVWWMMGASFNIRL